MNGNAGRKMAKVLMTALMALFFGGCTPVYLVQVNGFADPDHAGRLLPAARIDVVANVQAENPLLDREVKAKIEKILKGRGFVLSGPEKADYFCTFNYGLGIGLTKIDVIPVPHRPPSYTARVMMDGGAVETPTILLPGSTSYYPYARMEYDRWLKIIISAAGSGGEAKGGKTVWYGDVLSSGASRDLRTALSYMLIAAFEELGRDTQKGMVQEIRVDDERLRIFTAD